MYSGTDLSMEQLLNENITQSDNLQMDMTKTWNGLENGLINGLAIMAYLLIITMEILFCQLNRG